MKNTIPVLLLITLSACNGQNKSVVEKEATIVNTHSVNLKKSIEKSDGIIYFSRDNGMSWENNSNGLPEKISIGLGGIAVSSTRLGIVTKENGIYLFDFNENIWVNMPADSQLIQSNVGALAFFKNKIYIGTQYGGIFSSDMQGKTWTSNNSGLGNLTIRRFAEIDNRLFAGTNNGLYSYNEELNKWSLEYGQSSLQVNGIAESEGSIYIATNKGAFKSDKRIKNWEQVFSNQALHNITAFDSTIYAMTYNELFSSTDKGKTWQSIQQGLPKELYTFNVIKNNNAIFAGQWDGVYRKDILNAGWKFSGNGLPAKFAATNIKSYNGILVISCSERKLKAGVAIE